jgi:stage V sporulation protein AC
MNNSSYKYYTIHHANKSPIIKDCIWAFLVGGGICAFAEFLLNVYKSLEISENNSRTLVSMSLIFLTCLLSGIGVFDKIAKHAGAGTLVPITGFANAVVSPAIDYKAEGLVLGLAAKMFIIAGPVIVYGTVASVVYGIVYYITTLF